MLDFSRLPKLLLFALERVLGAFVLLDFSRLPKLPVELSRAPSPLPERARSRIILLELLVSKMLFLLLFFRSTGFLADFLVDFVARRSSDFFM